METEESGVGRITTLRSRLESRIESQRKTHLELLSSIQNVVPNLVSSLDLSLNLISNVNHLNFIPTPPLPEIPSLPPKLHANYSNSDVKQESSKNFLRSPEGAEAKRAGKFVADKSGSPMAVVKGMVAACLLQRMPFKPVDSSIISKKLESDANLTLAEKKALREVGGESDAILAVETAFKSIAEDNGGVELVELSINGKSRVMVLSIDKIRLLRELPESFQLKQEVNEGGNNQNQGQMDVFGIQRPEVWDPNMVGMASIYGRGGRMMGPRGRGGMMGMQRGGMMNSNNRQQKMTTRTEEDDWIDIQEMLSKKTYKESQRSKAGEELLDLIQRPTAKETAVAAKVFGLLCVCRMLLIITIRYLIGFYFVWSF